MNKKSQKIKRQRVGRPSKSKTDTSKPRRGEQDNTKQYIADFPALEQLFTGIAKCSNVRNIIKTGPKTTKGVNQTVDVKDSNKIIEERLKALNKQDHIYFIRNDPCVLVIQGDKIIDNTEYKQIIRPANIGEEFQGVYDQLNILARELDNDFIDEFEKIVRIFIVSRGEGKSLEQIIQDIDNDVKETNEFRILKEWKGLKEIGHEIKLQRAEQELKRREEDVDQKHSDKIKVKHSGLIEQQKTEIQQERQLGPLKYFIKNLVEGLEKLVESK
ncbi:hypothetical protein pb186bvf_004532 [Paramecium bursaria]